MFIDELFPVTISKDAESSVAYSTTVVTAKSGRKQKNKNWEYPLNTYDVSFGIRAMQDLEEVVNFFHVAEGKANYFRFKDWADYKSCSVMLQPSSTDQVIGVGDSLQTDFQLVKNYTIGGTTKVRKITHPLINTLEVAIDGVSTTAYSMGDNGLIKFNSAPSSNSQITAGYEYHVPVSFADDTISTQMDNYNNGNISLNLVEVRL